MTSKKPDDYCPKTISVKKPDDGDEKPRILRSNRCVASHFIITFDGEEDPPTTIRSPT